MASEPGKCLCSAIQWWLVKRIVIELAKQKVFEIDGERAQWSIDRWGYVSERSPEVAGVQRVLQNCVLPFSFCYINYSGSDSFRALVTTFNTFQEQRKFTVF